VYIWEIKLLLRLYTPQDTVQVLLMLHTDFVKKNEKTKKEKKEKRKKVKKVPIWKVPHNYIRTTRTIYSELDQFCISKLFKQLNSYTSHHQLWVILQYEQKEQQNMNHTVIQLKEFEVDLSRCLEALQCLAHTIVYVRSIGDAFEPVYQECTTFPLTYASCDEEQLSLLIDKDLKEFLRGLRRISPQERSGTIRICLNTKTNPNTTKTSTFEEWRISVIVSDTTPPASTDVVFTETRKRQDMETQHAVRERVFHIIKEAAESERKLPESKVIKGTTNKRPEPFPYDLSLTWEGRSNIKKKSSGGMLSFVKSAASSWFG
tara:strand:+ start:1157 stop:2110 length:954 start_codon:yes stop_codon:yes gene_type:complete